MLAILLIRGYSLQEALIRSGLVLVVVLFLLIVAGNIIRLSMRSRETGEEEIEIAEPIEHEAGTVESVEEKESEGSQATGT